MAGVAHYITAERPDVHVWWTDRPGGTLIDFSTGYTFVFKLGKPSQAAVFTKSTGITGAAGAGVEPTGTPNVVVSFTAAELALIAAGDWKAQITATTGGLDRVIQFPFRLAAVIT